MHTGEGLALSCENCGWCGDRLDVWRCPDCDGQLVPTYGTEVTDAGVLGTDAGELGTDAELATQWAFDVLVPPTDRPATLGEGGTPLIDCPILASELEVDTVAIKDEGHNPTGTVADRAISAAVTAARDAGATDLALPTTGADGVAAAAYAARAGLDAHVFVPTRSTHTTKAMINVHGGDMTVVEGRLPDAERAFRSALGGEDWTPIDPTSAPLRVAGIATAFPELVGALDGRAPDAVVVPVGHGELVVGLHAAARLLADLGSIDAVPAFHAIQPSGCAPIVRAAAESADAVPSWESSDTISGALEVPSPAHGSGALEAVRDSGGSAVAVDDEAILASACRIAAAEGLQASVAGGAAAAGAWELSVQGAFEPDDTVVVCNTAAGSLDADVLRSHLMRAG